jgi:hypothetical protein
VDNLKVAACIDDHSCDSTDVLCASFGFSVANNGIANFEKFLRNVLRLVLLEAHQEAGQERSSNDLELLSTRVRELNALIFVKFLSHPNVVVLF